MIKEKEKELFHKWRTEQQYQFFITDGLLDEDEWNKQDTKLLFVLKEANWEKGNADLCEFLLSESSPSYWKTWNNVARWIKALLEGGDYPVRVSNSDKSFWLRKVACMNLKKVGGDAVAENDTIRDYAERDATFLKAQIELYNPDMIICCGRGEGKNADILHDIVFSAREVSEWKKPYLSYNYFLYLPKNGKKVPVLSFYHPQMRGSHEKFKQRFEEMKKIGSYLKTMYMEENIDEK